MTNTPNPFEDNKSTGGSSPFESAPKGQLPLDMPSKEELKELRIIKQAIAKSFIEAGKVYFNPEVEEEIEKWIKWVYRSEHKDLELTK